MYCIVQITLLSLHRKIGIFNVLVFLAMSRATVTVVVVTVLIIIYNYCDMIYYLFKIRSLQFLTKSCHLRIQRLALNLYMYRTSIRQVYLGIARHVELNFPENSNNNNNNNINNNNNNLGFSKLRILIKESL